VEKDVVVADVAREFFDGEGGEEAEVGRRAPEDAETVAPCGEPERER
jgi:hypothetical protein